MRTARLSLEPLEARQLLAVTGTLSGVVMAGGAGIDGAQVALYEATDNAASIVATTMADTDGGFSLEYEVDDASILYVVAADGDLASSQVLLMSVVGQVGPDLIDSVHVNELTTVATVYSLSQFLDGVVAYGPSPGFDNAVATTFNLVDPQTGQPGEVVSNFNNGTTRLEHPRSTLALLTLNTLGNMMSVCATDTSGAACDELFALATPAGESLATNTIVAMSNIARNPVNPVKLDNELLYDFALEGTTYSPVLSEAPDNWLLVLHYTEGGFNGPGRIAFDAEGNVWSNNNFQLNPAGSVNPGKNIAVLNPVGEPILGSPIYGLGMLGSGYGTAVAPDGSVWIASFTNSSLAKFSPEGRPLRRIASKFVPNAADPDSRVATLHNPMGIAFDQQGNLWVPNSGGVMDDTDPGSVTVYLGGDPKQPVTWQSDAINKPFNIAIDGQGRAWVSNSGGNGGSVAVLELANGQLSVFQGPITSPALLEPGTDETVSRHSAFFTPRTIATDTAGNAWVNNLAGPFVTFVDGDDYKAHDVHIPNLLGGWGLAVDASDQVWVVSNNPFERSSIFILDGTQGESAPILGRISNPSLQLVTAVQIDSSGNVWAVDNWNRQSLTGNLLGGDGLTEFIGLGVPVKTPLVGPPESPDGSNALAAATDAAYEPIEMAWAPPVGSLTTAPLPDVASGRKPISDDAVPVRGKPQAPVDVAPLSQSIAVRRSNADKPRGAAVSTQSDDQLFADAGELPSGASRGKRLPWEKD